MPGQMVAIPPQLESAVYGIMESRTAAERLLALGNLLLLLPKLTHQDRAPVQEWIRNSFEPPLIQLAQRFVAAPKPYAFQCLVSNASLEQIAQEIMA